MVMARKSYDWMVVEWTLPADTEQQGGFCRINGGERLPMPDRYYPAMFIRLSQEGWLMVKSYSGDIDRSGAIRSEYCWQREAE